jgi:hypothetical protein
MAEPVVLPEDEIERLSLFFPIKVVNGFVTCDFELGCYCCKFCLNRRYPDWQRLLQKRRVYRNPLQVEQAAALLKQVKALTQAKVTLKFGHDTDMSLEEAEVQRLYGLMPPSQPMVFMRRGRLLPKHRSFYLTPRPNLLVELTVTPRSKYLDYQLDPFEILQSFEGVACQMFYTVGPVCHDNFDEAKAIIRAIPQGSKVWVKELIVKDIPAYAAAKTSDYGAETLREFAVTQGLRVVSYLNCVVRAEVGLGFHKRGEFVSEPNPWQLKWADGFCKVKDLCSRELPETEELDRINAALSALALTLARPSRKFGHKSYEVFVNEDINFGDECYVREITGLKVDLYKPGRKTGTALSRAIVDRWRETQFFPVDEMLALAKESFNMAFAE